MSDDARLQLAQLLGYVMVAAILIWIISFAIRSANAKTKSDGDGWQRYTQEYDRERVDPAKEYTKLPPSSDGPGRYRVDGVDKETQMDTTVYVKAQKRLPPQK